MRGRGVPLGSHIGKAWERRGAIHRRDAAIETECVGFRGEATLLEQRVEDGYC